MKTIYSILGMIAFVAFIVYYVSFGLPHIPLLLFAMFFAILYKLEEFEK